MNLPASRLLLVSKVVLFVLTTLGSAASAQVLFTPTASVGSTASGNNNIGIGTSTPEYRLHSTGDVGVAADMKFIARYSNANENYRATFGWSHLQLGNNGPNWIVAGRNGTGGSLTFVVNNTNDYTYNGYDGIKAMHISPTGNVGIGTTSPTSVLEVKGGSVWQGTIRVNSSAGQYSSYGWMIGDSPQWSAYVHPAEPQTGALIFANASGADLVTFRQNGYVGIGTTVPGYKLDVRDATDAQIAAFETGSGNANRIIIGANANEAYVQELYSSTAKPLVFKINGEYMRIATNGNVGIGTTNPTQKLSVNGTIRAKEIIVDTNWADYVFEPNYRLAPLNEVENAIKQDGHLPGIPSAQEVAAHGISVGEIQATLLAKIEELTLHQIAQEKKLASLQIQNDAQNAEIAALKSQLARQSK
jgi:hypothetical protein